MIPVMVCVTVFWKQYVRTARCVTVPIAKNAENHDGE
jgi:hypothetical protein